MTPPPDTTKNLATLLKKLEGAEAEDGTSGAATLALPPIVGDDMGEVDPVRELVYSMLVWEAGESKAAAGAKRLAEGVVDINELRSCLEDEIVRLIGPRYPKAAERAARLRACLNQIYNDGNTVSLERLKSMSKRDARAYLDALTGMPAFVAARVLLLSLGGHAFPLDRRLHKILSDAKAIEVDPYAEGAGAWVERQIRAGEALGAYLALEQASERKPSRKRSGARGGSEGGRRKASDKSVS